MYRITAETDKPVKETYCDSLERAKLLCATVANYLEVTVLVINEFTGEIVYERRV